MLTVHRFSQIATVEVLGKAPVLSSELEAKVERLWQAEQLRRGKTLFNGRILSASEIQPTKIVGHFVEYRRLIAQIARPELFDTLRVKPVAVSGMLLCSEGIVFGRRAAATTQDSGLWELVPSGGIDTSELNGEGRVDFLSQILTELREETGIGRDKVANVAPFCLVEDQSSHVLDIGIALEAPTLSSEAVFQTHSAAGSNEYDELKVVPCCDLAEFIERTGSQLVSVSSELLRAYKE